MAYANHVDYSSFSAGALVVPWNEVNLASRHQPNVFVGKGGHASYPQAGETRVGLHSEEHRGGIPFSLIGKVDYLPRAGSLSANDWLIYPGHWGSPDLDDYPTSTASCANPVGDSGAPRGPIYLDATRRIWASAAVGRGTRWLDPWAWEQSSK